MGQTAAAVLVGIMPSKTLTKRLYDDDGEPIWDDLPYERQPETGEFRDCLGFAVVVSNGGDDDEGEITKSAALERFGATYAKDTARAQQKWSAFSAWVLNKKGIELPAPTLLLTMTERV